jgi:hypothetical protein
LSGQTFIYKKWKIFFSYTFMKGLKYLKFEFHSFGKRFSDLKIKSMQKSQKVTQDEWALVNFLMHALNWLDSNIAHAYDYIQ